MAERRSALAQIAAAAAASKPGAASSPTTLRELRPGSIVQIVAWPSTAASIQLAIADLLGVDVPPLGGSTGNSGTTLLSLGPGRMLLLSDTADSASWVEGALPPADGTATDISHGRALLRIEGAGGASMLARCVAIDLAPRAFPPGRVAQTAIHHIDVTILRRGEDVFDLIVLRGFAESLTEWLLDAGLEFGVVFAR